MSEQDIQAWADQLENDPAYQQWLAEQEAYAFEECFV